MTELQGVLYTSTLSPEATLADVPAIMAVARHRNLRDGITGVLVFDGQNFCQHIEGDHDPLQACMQRIRDDTRHVDLRLHHSGGMPQRHFGRFRAGYASTEDEDLFSIIRGLQGPAALRRFLAFLPTLDLDA
ncbi:MAG: BLUF domain-containing protein [Ramlibacter sp.]|nr:BLUF domain-containing protein [Ramlibacter sp.]MBX3658311.1 BLUF domain-containing protein [Ramlibacter sp.]MCW5650036.1 BLUF domain-containing protein [Ramlibacter sp.]